MLLIIEETYYHPKLCIVIITQGNEVLKQQTSTLKSGTDRLIILIVSESLKGFQNHASQISAQYNVIKKSVNITNILF